jgi:hypothetical protein
VTTAERKAYKAREAFPKQVEAISNAWDEAAQGVHFAKDHPIKALQNMGDFEISAAQSAWDKLRETYESGQMAMNAIDFLFDTPCENKWQIVLETALPAAGAALYVLLVPSPKEVLENYLEPKSLRKGHRGSRDIHETRRKETKSHRRRRFWPRIPDVDHLVANALPAREAVAGRQAGRPTRWIFDAIDVADRVSWYWMLADIGEDFFIKWTSNIMEARFCSKPIRHLMQIEQVENYQFPPTQLIRPPDPIIHTQRLMTWSPGGVFQMVDESGDPEQTTIIASMSRQMTCLTEGSHPPPYQYHVQAVLTDSSGFNPPIIDTLNTYSFFAGTTLPVGGQITASGYDTVTFTLVQDSNVQGTTWNMGTGTAMIAGA